MKVAWLCGSSNYPLAVAGTRHRESLVSVRQGPDPRTAAPLALPRHEHRVVREGTGSRRV